jgi:DNA-binding MarR family transcriptional regulator
MSGSIDSDLIPLVLPLGGAADSLSAAGVAMLRSVERLRHEVGGAHGLSVTEMRGLSRIAEAGELTPKQLAAALALSTGAVTSVADRLIIAGVVERVAHPTDRRSLLLSLTEHGRDVSTQASIAFREAVRLAVGDHSEDEILLAAHFLNTAAARISEVSDRYAVD